MVEWPRTRGSFSGSEGGASVAIVAAGGGGGAVDFGGAVRVGCWAVTGGRADDEVGRYDIDGNVVG